MVTRGRGGRGAAPIQTTAAAASAVAAGTRAAAVVGCRPRVPTSMPCEAPPPPPLPANARDGVGRERAPRRRQLHTAVRRWGGGGDAVCEQPRRPRSGLRVFFFPLLLGCGFRVSRWNVTHHPPLIPSVRRGGAKYLRGPGFWGGYLPSGGLIWSAVGRCLEYTGDTSLTGTLREPFGAGGGGTAETNLAQPGEATCVMVAPRTRGKHRHRGGLSLTVNRGEPAASAA